MSEDPEAPKKRGRPRKHPLPDPNAPKRGPGRPKKVEQDPEGPSEEDVIGVALLKPLARKAALQMDEPTLRIIAECGKLMCTQAECAAVLGVTLRQLQHFFASHTEARDMWDDGLAFSKVKLRSVQFKLAERNQVIAIFLGKQILGQKDTVHTDLTVNKPAHELTEEQLFEIAQQGLALAPMPANNKVH